MDNLFIGCTVWYSLYSLVGQDNNNCTAIKHVNIKNVVPKARKKWENSKNLLERSSYMTPPLKNKIYSVWVDKFTG